MWWHCHFIKTHNRSILEEKKIVEVCYTPAQYELYRGGFDIIVVIDVLRATSAMTTALHHGVEKIIPVASLDEANAYKAKGFTVGAERDGQVVEGFDFGNSPYVYIDNDMSGKTVVLTTTNGTKSIEIAKNDGLVVIGCLNNLDHLCQWLIAQNKNTLILASGWKDKVNLEDTICAGAIADQLIQSKKYHA